MFYVAEALLLTKGLTFSSHAAVISAFGQHFAKTGLVESRLHRYLIESAETRFESDYLAELNITAPQAAEQIAHAE